ncbi:hypothetical protein K8Z61_14455 [Nocardioides sp. TRM66260-LWL]|uniref:hypothetical protein n=1 Tax=Nocardioides sp. TRM66260-LWL TaxID=2874478 RepID=UPI001CC414F4|nr:hypothetical protein [Nocardioides sp. TRM66260-LWL]MBZ5735693.1 hypothetical protein [Nocardioides sp. TRM66260-LWL]
MNRLPSLVLALSLLTAPAALAGCSGDAAPNGVSAAPSADESAAGGSATPSGSAEGSRPDGSPSAGGSGAPGASGGSGAPGASGGSDASSTPSGQATVAGGRLGDAPVVDSDSVFVVTGVAAARRSVDQVQLLHALWVASVDDTGIPRAERPRFARQVQAQLRELVVTATRLPPPSGSAPARLVASLRTYDRLAGQLRAGGGTRVPASFAGAIADADAAWRSALKALGAIADQDLLKDLPTLASPSAG